MMIAASGRGGGTNGKRASERFCQLLNDLIQEETQNQRVNTSKVDYPLVIKNAINIAQKELIKESVSRGVVMQAAATLALIAENEVWVSTTGGPAFFYKASPNTPVKLIYIKEIGSQAGFATDEPGILLNSCSASVMPFNSQSMLVIGTGEFWKYIKQDEIEDIFAEPAEMSQAERITRKVIQSGCSENISLIVVRGGDTHDKNEEIECLKSQLAELRTKDREMTAEMQHLNEQLVVTNEKFILLCRYYSKLLDVANNLVSRLLAIASVNPQLISKDELSWFSRWQQDIQSERTRMTGKIYHRIIDGEHA